MNWLRTLFTGVRQKDVPARLPEADVVVTVTDATITVAAPGRAVQEMAWGDLESVEIHTNSLGPFVADLSFVLRGGNQVIEVPGLATGEEALLRALQTLPGFDNEVAIRAMGSTTDAVFPCWRRR